MKKTETLKKRIGHLKARVAKKGGEEDAKKQRLAKKRLKRSQRKLAKITVQEKKLATKTPAEAPKEPEKAPPEAPASSAPAENTEDTAG